MNTTPYEPFHRDLAEKAKWPLRKASDPNESVTIMKWDCRGKRPFAAIVTDGVTDWPELLSEGDMCLSADYSSPAVRAAVQRSHEKLGMELKHRRKQTNKDVLTGAPEHQWMSFIPDFNWDLYDYRLAIHLADPIAPGHNPDKLTVAQVGEGWRLVDKEEGWRAHHSSEWWNAVEYYYGGWAKCYSSPNSWNNEISTLRTRLSRSELAALDNPKCSHQYGRIKVQRPEIVEVCCSHCNEVLEQKQYPQPWSLSRHLPGFRALRDGEQWHRLNGWKPEMIWPGWRPKLMGEEVLPGDVSFDGDFQHIFKYACGKANEMDNPKITKRPLPEPPAPRDLTKEDLEEVDGLRFKWNGTIFYPLYLTFDSLITHAGNAGFEITSYIDLRRHGWLYRGHGFGWRKCEKEGR